MASQSAPSPVPPVSASKPCATTSDAAFCPSRRTGKARSAFTVKPNSPACVSFAALKLSDSASTKSLTFSPSITKATAKTRAPSRDRKSQVSRSGSGNWKRCAARCKSWSTAANTPRRRRPAPSFARSAANPARANRNRSPQRRDRLLESNPPAPPPSDCKGGPIQRVETPAASSHEARPGSSNSPEHPEVLFLVPSPHVEGAQEGTSASPSSDDADHTTPQMTAE